MLIAGRAHLHPVPRPVIDFRFPREPAVGHNGGRNILAHEQMLLIKTELAVRNNQVSARPFDRTLKGAGAEHQRKPIIRFSCPRLHQRRFAALERAAHKHGALQTVHRVLHKDRRTFAFKVAVIKLSAVILDVLNPDCVIAVGDFEIDIMAFVIQPHSVFHLVTVRQLQSPVITSDRNVRQLRSVAPVIGHPR